MHFFRLLLLEKIIQYDIATRIGGFVDKAKENYPEGKASNSQIASAIGISPSMLSDYLSGKKTPSLEVVGKMIDFFKKNNQGFSADDFFNSDVQIEEQEYESANPLEDEILDLLEELQKNGCDDIVDDIFFDAGKGQFRRIRKLKKLLDGDFYDKVKLVQLKDYKDNIKPSDVSKIVDTAFEMCDTENIGKDLGEMIKYTLIKNKLENLPKDDSALAFIAKHWLANNKKPD